MILESIELKNIRSYNEQKIEFPTGITLFQGGMGSGKSTILMAVEFALFGTGSQKGPTLLSTKAKDGSVILKFAVDGQNYEVKRELERTTKSVRQHPKNCHLKIGNEIQPFSPSELKHEILKILRFNEPDAANAQSKIYRYAVFTPQEEMKYILYDSDKRQETIRRAFGVEDYKNAKENAIKVSKGIKIKSKIFQDRSRRIPDIEKALRELQTEADDNNNLERENNGKKIENENKKEKIRNEIEDIDKKSRKKVEFENKKQKHEGVLENLTSDDLEDEIEQLVEKIRDREEGIIDIENKKKPTEITKDVIEMKIDDIKKIENKRGTLLHNEDEINDLEDEIEQLVEKIRDREEGIIDIENKKKPTEITKDVIEMKIDDIKKIENKRGTLLHNKSAYSQSISKLKKLGTKCLFCNQDITKEHSEKLIDEQNDALSKIHEALDEIDIHIKDILNDTGIDSIENPVEELLELKQGLEIYEQSQASLSKLKGEQKEDKGKLVDKNKKKDQIDDDLKELDEIDIHIKDILNDTGIDSIENPVEELLELKQGLEIYEQSQASLSKLKGEQKEDKGKLVDKNKKKDQIDKQVLKLKNLITELKKEIDAFPDYEKEKKEKNGKMKDIDEELIRITSTLGGIKQKKIDLKESITSTKKELTDSIRWKHKHNELETYETWIKQFFIPSTEQIEKQVLNSIRHDFNETYRDWFKILIDDTSKDSRLDEDFTPIIEQDGELQDFDNLSGGEKTSVSLAYRLSLNTMMRRNTESLKSNLLILDEPTDGFSKSQLSKVRDVLKALGSEQIILVSHERELETYVDNIFQVSRSQGYSKIKRIN